MKRPGFLLFTLLFGVLSTFGADLACAQGPWRLAGTDLETLRVETAPDSLFNAEVLLLRTSLNAFRVEIIRASDFGQPRASVAEICKLSKAAVCINANFFDESGNPLGLVVHRGIQVQNMHRGGKTLTGVFVASREKITIVPRATYQAERVVEAVQAGPRILHAHAPVAGVEVKGRSRRSGVCIDDENRLYFFITASGLFGASMDEVQNILRSKQVNCSEALNLDGGGSSQLYVSENIPGATHTHSEIYVPGRDDVPVALGLFPKS
jgi:exopolysaccharide biosynthesis protein